MLADIMTISHIKKLNGAPKDEVTIGGRLAQIRKEKGYTQVELAQKLGLLQVQISDYERGRSRLNAEMAASFAKVLKVSADELLGIKSADKKTKKTDRRFLRRLEQLENLPKRDQQALLRTIDAYLGKAS